MLRRVSLLLASILFAALAHAEDGEGAAREVKVGSTAFALGDTVPSWVKPQAVPADDSKAPAALLLMDSQIHVDQTPAVYARRVIRVSDASLLSSAGQILIPFFPDYQRLHLHYIHVLRAGAELDRTKSSSLRFLQRETGLDVGEYDGAVSASILINDLRVGDTIDIAYSVDGANPVFGGKYFNSFLWDSSMPITSRHVSLQYPTARPLQWKLYTDSTDLPLPKPVSHDEGGWSQLDFVGQHIPALSSHAGTPPGFSEGRWLEVSEFKDWNEVSRWADQLFVHDAAADAAVAPVVADLRQRYKTQAEQLVGALDFVESEIRYFSLSLDEGSYRPTSPAVVLQRRYGDCKDKTLLLKTLLDQLGIESHAVLLNNGVRYGLDRMLAAPQLFDHAILQVVFGGKTYFLDPTLIGQRSPIDLVGKTHIGEFVLVVRPDTQGLIRVPDTRPDGFVDVATEENFDLPDFDKDATLEVKSTYHGLEADDLRAYYGLLTEEQWRKAALREMQERYSEAMLVDGPTFKDDVASNTFSVTSHFRVPKLMAEANGAQYLRYLPTSLKGMLLPGKNPHRTVPLAITRYPMHAQYTLTAQFPESVGKSLDPASDKVEDGLFRFKASGFFRGNHAKLSFDLASLADHIDVSDFSRYSEDFDKIGALMPGAVVITRDDIKAKGFLGFGVKSFSEQLRDGLRKANDVITKDIDGNKLNVVDLAAGYMARAYNESTLEQFPEALRDADTAARLQKQLPAPLFCRAQILYESGQFKPSIELYSRAIAGGYDPLGDAYVGRSLSEYFAGNLDAAVADLQQAAQIKADQAPDPYQDIWYALMLQRKGLPVPDGIRQRAQSHEGDWPQPLLAVVAGNYAEEKMLAALEHDKQGDELRMNQTEAYFYLGEMHLTRGQTELARQYFQKARDLGVITYVEYRRSDFELKKLGAPAAH